ncbi:hypothetical protein H257_17893 [Aphanomyces astaci]|uniref:Uncharacterized protein n=1 Tax=Aphanomyces astaci TaxID=112090 RepID=W4FCY7_APHAT|nr:hypothetical protein H257_17893 [Aphanomyces astaci]ETV65362.1 hypothetical protein H257_17893 [Aphanomyces astaci]|eukprot:XP_009845157.1 hypothetical protein H257_17893 [Aphanomyces astaci]
MTKKHVSFATTKTVAEFHIAHNPTTVPHVGPSVGLEGPPICISSVPILDHDEVVATHGKKRRALCMEPVRCVVMLRRQVTAWRTSVAFASKQTTSNNRDI